MLEQPTFQKTHQKQEPIKNTKFNKTMGTNNEGNIQEYKTHGKSKPIKLIITKKQKHMNRKYTTKIYVQTTLVHNQNN